MSKVPHFARLNEAAGTIFDPSIRGNLQTYGRFVGDIPEGQTTFTVDEWNSLVQRLPNVLRGSGQ
jgi:hypothetical protein